MEAEPGVPEWLQHQLGESFGVEKVRIRLSGPNAIACMLRIGWDGDLLPHLETHFKVFGDLRQVASELVCGWWPVEGRIIAHRAEERLAVVVILTELPKAYAGKARLGVLPLIDLSLPTFVSPRGRAETDERGHGCLSHRQIP